jgi:hypothetical protein
MRFTQAASFSKNLHDIICLPCPNLNKQPSAGV